MASGIFVGGTLGGIGGGGGVGGMAAQYADPRNQIQPAPAVSPMARHAEVVHKLAEELQQLNNRLTNAIDRVVGPCPELASSSKDCPSPGQGTLLVAQFGAERISLGINQLAELITRLEGIV